MNIFFHFVQVPSAPLCRMANLTTATERSSSDLANRRVTKRRVCSETHAEYYDVLSECRLFVTITESHSALTHFSDQWFLALRMCSETRAEYYDVLSDCRL